MGVNKGEWGRMRENEGEWWWMMVNEGEEGLNEDWMRIEWEWMRVKECWCLRYFWNKFINYYCSPSKKLSFCFVLLINIFFSSAYILFLLSIITLKLLLLLHRKATTRIPLFAGYSNPQTAMHSGRRPPEVGCFRVWNVATILPQNVAGTEDLSYPQALPVSGLGIAANMECGTYTPAHRKLRSLHNRKRGK